MVHVFIFQETENLSANLNFFHKTLITWSFHKPMETCVDDIKMLSISGMWAEVKRDLFGDIRLVYLCFSK